MKVLLTGATGFVGSHILEKLLEHGIKVAVLLRPSSNREFLPGRPEYEMRIGSFSDAGNLKKALCDVTHIIHCAGCVKACTDTEFFEVNEAGTRKLIEAANALAGQIERFVLVSSLAAAGPGLPANPAREESQPAPVSTYGRSKLAGEKAVRDGCASDYVILRPPAVYGPRDREFLRLFQAAARHIRPRPGLQPLSVVFVEDLAEATVRCLTHPVTRRNTYFVASSEVVTARRMADEVAEQMGTWGLPLPLPNAALWPLCLFSECWSRLSRKASVLSLQKYQELKAPGWVCSSEKLTQDTDYRCKTDLREGITRTLKWYREQGWVKA